MSSKFWGGLLAGAMLLPTASQAEVLTFEDLPGFLRYFTLDYRGFKFGNNNANSNAWFYDTNNSPYYLAHSGRKFALTDRFLYPDPPQSLVATMPITNPVDFKFDGAWFSGAEWISYKLYNNGQLVHTSAPSAELGPAPIYVASGYGGLVDSVVILGTNGYYVMDDFTYNTPVPESSTWAMMAAGLLAMGALWRRRAAA